MAELAYELVEARCPQCGTSHPVVERQQARIAELEKDAARYRWLRDASVMNGAIDPDNDDFWNDLGDLLGEKFDAAIDAARGKG